MLEAQLPVQHARICKVLYSSIYDHVGRMRACMLQQQHFVWQDIKKRYDTMPGAADWGCQTAVHGRTRGTWSMPRHNRNLTQLWRGSLYCWRQPLHLQFNVEAQVGDTSYRLKVACLPT